MNILDEKNEMEEIMELWKSEREPPVFSVDEVKRLVDLPEWKILNIYRYGSTIYGTNHEYSDFDCLVVANSLNRDKEINNGTYNVHIHTPDKFEDDLRNGRMVNLECVFAPSYAILQTKKDYTNIKFDPIKLKREILKQSHDSWIKANMKFRERDIERALKSLFHSLRILVFGNQIIESGKIIDFSAANMYWDEIKVSEDFRWNFYKEKYLPLKKDLENILIDSTTENV